MTAKAGYVGAFYLADTTTLTAVPSEAVGTGDGSTTSFDLANENVENDNLTVIIGTTTQQIGRDFTITPKGTVRFTTAPISDGAIKVTYDYYAAMLARGGFTGWSFDAACDMVDSTDFSSAGWREFTPVLRGWTGTADRHWIQKIESDFVGDKYLVEFFTDEANDKYYTGWCIINGVSPTAPVDALIDESISFQGTYMLGTQTT